jgi:hypothetical protein
MIVATLERWASGVSATCGEPWTDAAITTAVERGPHTSALTLDALKQIEGEVQYQTAAWFLEVVLWHNLHSKLLPVNLQISPLAAFHKWDDAVGFSWTCSSPSRLPDP